MTSSLPFLFPLLLLLPLISAATPPQSFLNAAENLSSSGYNAMSLTISLLLTDTSISPSLQNTNSSHPTLTIFTPPDSSFVNAGQPSLSKLLSHFSPLSLPFPSLSSLPLNSKIPTLSPFPLTLTSTSSPLSINNITVVTSSIYDDGYIIIFAIQDFFPPNFTIANSTPPPSPPQPECSVISPYSTLFDASTRMKARGYAIMASFLELQLIGYLKFERENWPLKLTMFAPEDEVLVDVVGDVGGYSGLFIRHVLPCKMSFGDLSLVANGTVFEEYFDGISVTLERNDNEFFVNGVRITFPELYSSDWLVVHGISAVIRSQGSDGFGGDEEMEVENEEEESSPGSN